jgi:hypothetical protein
MDEAVENFFREVGDRIVVRGKLFFAALGAERTSQRRAAVSAGAQ